MCIRYAKHIFSYVYIQKWIKMFYHFGAVCISPFLFAIYSDFICVCFVILTLGRKSSAQILRRIVGTFQSLCYRVIMIRFLRKSRSLPYYLNLFCTLMHYTSLFICLLIVPYSSRNWHCNHFSGHSLSPHHSTRKLPILSALFVNRFT